MKKPNQYEYTDHFFERIEQRFGVKGLTDFITHFVLIKYQFAYSVAEKIRPREYLVFVKGYPAIVVLDEKTLVTIYHAN